MASEEKQQDRGFRVVDKRASAEGAEGAAAEPDEGRETGALPKVDFSTFCLSLGTSALYHLGVVGDPESGQTTPTTNLFLARQTIDTLEMLQAKTQGNLDADETRMLESLLYELRMRYVEVSKADRQAEGRAARRSRAKSDRQAEGTEES